MNKICFVSCAFGERYVAQQLRLNDSINKVHPEAGNIFTTDVMPLKSKSFNDSLYGFKPHIINEAREAGYKKIIFFDPACIVVDKVDYYFDIIKDYGVIAVKDDNLLGNWTSQIALNYYGMTRGQCLEKGYHLVGGSIYVFDFDLPLCNSIFDTWEKAESDGLFGTEFQASTEQINSHRNDETCMSFALYLNGSKPVPYDIARYNDVPNPIVIKKHFK
jgi:hypothetical protein